MIDSSKKSFPDRLLVSLGGNAIHPEGIKGTGQEQFEFARLAVITHLEDASEAILGTAGTQVIK